MQIISRPGSGLFPSPRKSSWIARVPIGPTCVQARGGGTVRSGCGWMNIGICCSSCGKSITWNCFQGLASGNTHPGPRACTRRFPRTLSRMSSAWNCSQPIRCDSTGARVPGGRRAPLHPVKARPSRPEREPQGQVPRQKGGRRKSKTRRQSSQSNDQ